MNSFIFATPFVPSESNSVMLLPPGITSTSSPASLPARTSAPSSSVRSISGDSFTRRNHSTAPMPPGPLSAYTPTLSGAAAVQEADGFSFEQQSTGCVVEQPHTAATAQNSRAIRFIAICLSKFTVGV